MVSGVAAAGSLWRANLVSQGTASQRQENRLKVRLAHSDGLDFDAC